jgi:hypothetical protein
MKAFIAACLVAVVIAVGAAAILEDFVQESSAAAFAEPSARI